MSLIEREFFTFGCTRLWLNRPDARNSLSQGMREELIEALLLADQDSKTAVILIQGRGGHFCAGGDLLEFSEDTPERLRERDAGKLWVALNSVRKPLIAAVHGAALGAGCELALCADLLIAESDAEFGQPEVGWGLIPGGGATQRLVHRLGYPKAALMIMGGLRYTADEMGHTGLVSAVVQSGNLDRHALEIAALLCSRSSSALELAKKCLRAAETLSLPEGLRYERSAFESLFGTPDQREGAQAFKERRTPQFKKNQ